MFKKLFCKHKWKTHAKDVHEWNDLNIVNGTDAWFNPALVGQKKRRTTEILICEECGAIKKIIY